MYFKLLASNNYHEQVNKEINEMYNSLVEDYKAKWNVIKEFKMKNQMKWVQLMNNIDNVVTKVIIRELIYI